MFRKWAVFKLCVLDLHCIFFQCNHAMCNNSAMHCWMRAYCCVIHHHATISPWQWLCNSRWLVNVHTVLTYVSLCTYSLYLRTEDISSSLYNSALCASFVYMLSGNRQVDLILLTSHQSALQWLNHVSIHFVLVCLCMHCDMVTTCRSFMVYCWFFPPNIHGLLSYYSVNVHGIQHEACIPSLQTGCKA